MILANIQLSADKLKPQNYPENPQTIGEHIKHVRINRGLLQKEVAKLLGVNGMTITNWENNKGRIQTLNIPRVVEFLNYVPDVLKDFQPLKSEIFLYRCKYRITQREMAKRLGIDASTLHAKEWKKRETIERTKSLIDNYKKL